MKRPVLIAAMAAVILTGTSTAAQAGTKLPCNNGGGTAVLTVKPKACTVLPPRASFSDGSNLGKLRWSSFGGSKARFRGIEKGFHLPFSKIKVTGYAYRPRPNRCGASRVYTRVYVKSRFGSIRVKTQACVR